MPNREIRVCHDYEELVLRRGTDPHNFLVPRDHTVDWEDQPSRFKIYREVIRIPLAFGVPKRLGSLAGVMASWERHQTGPEEISYEQLSTLLLFTNGILQRKLDINWNLDHTGRAHQMHAVYSRPAASGGGMYPCELYLATAQRCSFPPGVYHYDNAHHALERLGIGDMSHRVREAAFGHPKAVNADHFILVSLNFWKNSFKYNNFCYHVVTQDLGALLGTMRLVASSLGIEATLLFWFKDEALNRLLGIETLTESVFAVVALAASPAAKPKDDDAKRRWSARKEETPQLDSPVVKKISFQRSKRILRLPLVERVHQSALIEEEPPPAASEISQAHCEELTTLGERLPLPAPTIELLHKDLAQIFLFRHSSWGRMISQPSVELQKAAAVLRCAAIGQNYACDLRQGCPTTRFARIMLFANHLQNVPAGIYSYDAVQHCLWTVRAGDISLQLQQHYFLQNYNLEQAALVIAVVGSVDRMLQVFGNRGLRILNAEVGLIAQHIYMASAALSLGCGAVLGFDNIAVNTLLGLEGSDQTSLLLILVGCERGPQTGFSYLLI